VDRIDTASDMSRAVSDGRYKYISNFHPELPVLQRTDYREKLLMMKDLHALKNNGQATPQQWQIVSDRKPREEFYDTRSDPHELTNIIDEPAHEDRIGQMRTALDQWMNETGDLGRIQPESKLVREKLWPPAGVQPTTAPPRATSASSPARKPTLTIACETEGASIGYRRKGDKSWAVYTKAVEIDTKAVEIDGSVPYEVVAHRIGFKPSAVETVKPQQ
jgi:hypothetical protein